MNAKKNDLQSWGIILASAVVFLAMNVYTPKIGDDYYWEYIPGTEKRIESVQDIFTSIYNYYMAEPGTDITGGRVTAVFITQLNLMMGKSFFNFFNTLLYIALALLMYFHVTGGIKKINALLYLFINILIWYLVPSWGEDFLWLTGSCFYVFPLTIILFFLVPLRKYHDDPSYRMNGICLAVYPLCGIFAGLSYENAGAGLFVLMVVYFFAKKIKNQKLKSFEIAGTIGFIVGFIILLAAPGNYSRLDSYEFVRQYGFIKRTTIRFIYTTYIYFKNYGVLLTGLCIIMMIDRYREKQNTLLFPVFYLAGGIASAYSMVLSPVFIDRVYFPVSIFLIIAFFNYVLHSKIPSLVKRNAKPLVILIVLIFSFSLVNAGMAVYKSYRGDPSLNTSERHYGQEN